jgi:hypothetical protein
MLVVRLVEGEDVANGRGRAVVEVGGGAPKLDQAGGVFKSRVIRRLFYGLTRPVTRPDPID